VRLRDVNDTENMALGAGLNQQAKVVRAGRTQRPGTEDEGRHRTAVIIAGIFGGAGVFDIESRFDILKQARLHAQDGFGIVTKIGIHVGPCRKGSREKRKNKCRGERNHAMFHIRLDAMG
jgi:hypothetical protein